MFEALTDKLGAVFQRIGSRGRLTESDIDEALREVRIALLEADVNFRVAREFVARVRERSMGADVLRGLNPGQQVVKIVNEELTATLSAGDHSLHPGPSTPSVILLVGLQGSGKTTTAAKLALHLQADGRRKAALVAADLRRPAAIEQLVSLGRQLGVAVYSEDPSAADVVGVAKRGVAEAGRAGAAWVIVDTGGRLAIDDDLMAELATIKSAVSPQETLLVADAMTGQDAVRTATEFHDRARLTGLVLTKMDGDARGGAALSITAVTGVPIKFIGVGERPEALEAFHPDRMASRILGMGDVLTFIERAQEAVDEQQAQEMERKLRRANFDLQDFLDQLRTLKRMGPLAQVMEMVPGFSGLKGRLGGAEADEGRLGRVEAMVLSMTPAERRNPDILNGSRRRRIAAGSGVTVQDLNQLMNQFRQMQKLIKQMSGGGGGGRGRRDALRGLMGK
jgi:signal recognition particle subunit SRP54